MHEPACHMGIVWTEIWSSRKTYTWSNSIYTSIKPIGSRGLTCSRWSLCALWTRPKAHQSGRTDSFQDWHWSKVLLSRGQAAYYHPCLVSHPGILRIVMDSVWCWVCCQKMLFIQNIQRCQTKCWNHWNPQKTWPSHHFPSNGRDEIHATLLALLFCFNDSVNVWVHLLAGSTNLRAGV